MNAANVSVDGYWYDLYAHALKNMDKKQIGSMAGIGGAPAAAVGTTGKFFFDY